MPSFWKGADIDDPDWRRAYMGEPFRRYGVRLPFDDDLTDLVLSTVCRRPEPEIRPPGPTPAAVGNGTSDQEAGAKEAGNQEAEARTGGVAGLWESEVQATISRIADTVKTTLETEKVRLLGKRDRQEEVETVELHKRQKSKTVEDVSDSPRPIINTIEDNDGGGDGAPRSHTVLEDEKPAPSTDTAADPKDEERYRAWKTGYKKLKNHNRQLAASLAELNDKYKRLSEKAELMAFQYRDLRSDYDTSKDKVQQLAQTCARLEDQIRTLVERGLQVADKCSTVSEDVKKLEDKSGQLAIQGTALKDENVLMKAQMVGILGRVDTLERSVAAHQSHQSQTQCAGRVTAAGFTNGPDPAEGSGVVSSQRHPAQNGSSINGRHDAGPSAMPGSQGQSNRACKYDGDDSVDMRKVPLYRKPAVQSGNQTRASSRFPRILEMPTFDLEESHEEESARRNVPEATNAQNKTTHTDTTVTTPGRLTTTHSHGNPAAEGPIAIVNLTHEPHPAPVPAQMSSTAVTASTQVPAAVAPIEIGQTSTVPAESSPSIVAAQEVHPQAFAAQTEAQSKEHTAEAPTSNRIPDADVNTTETARLSPACRDQAFSFLKWLGPQVWTAPTQEIVARCRNNGMEYDRLDDLVEEFKIIVGGHLGVVDAEGRWIGGAGREGDGEGTVPEGA
jgi:polyhydroxyalkanoate synthesis regulator phasin